MDIINILYQYLIALANCVSYIGDGNFQNDTSAFSVTINTSNVLHTVDERFLSLSFSPRLLGNSTAHDLFRTHRFRALLQGLAPCYLRAGGTAGESVTFHSSHSPPGRSASVDDVQLEYRKFQPITMYADDWEFINNLAMQNGAHLLFQINDMKRKNENWDDENFLELLNYSLDKPYSRKLGFEFGNEPNAYKKTFNQTISATKHGQEFLRAAQILKHQHPYASVFNNSLLVSPDVTQPKKKILKYMQEFLAVAGDYLDRITWHQYYLRGKSEYPIGIQNFTDPNVLDDLGVKIQSMQDAVKEVGYAHKDMWLGETGSASGGGVPGYSNRFVAGFMWLDKLGLAAKMGIKVVVRQTLYGFDNHYALIYDDIEPLPDYWLSHVFKLLVGKKVYQTEVSDESRKLRCYSASYAKDTLPINESTLNVMATETNITLYCLNMHQKAVHIALDVDIQFHKVFAYILQSHGEEGLRSRHAQLNGRKLEMEDNKLPHIEPVDVDAHRPLLIPASSMAFFTVHRPNNDYNSC